MDKQLLRNLINGECERSPEFDSTICPDADVIVFTVEGENRLCKIWNSSNDEPFNKKKACKQIADKILEEDGVDGGSILLEFNEIMFEITEKSSFKNPEL